MLAVIIEGIAIHRLVFKQIFGNTDECITVLGEYLFAQDGCLVENTLHLFVDECGCLLGVALSLAEIAADEDAVIRAVVLDGAKLFAHTVARHHIARNARRLLDIAGCAGGNIVKEELFGNSAAKTGHDALEHLCLGGKVLRVLIRAIERKAAGHSARNDGDIVHGVGVLQELRSYGMT